VRGDVLKFSTVGAHHGIGDIFHQRPALRFGVLPFRRRRLDAIPREGRPLTCDEHRRRTVQKNDRDALRHLVVGAVPFVRDQDIGELLHQPRFGVRLQRSFGNGDIDHRHGGLSPWLRLYCFDWRADGTSMREVLWTSGADRQWQYRHLSRQFGQAEPRRGRRGGLTGLAFGPPRSCSAAHYWLSQAQSVFSVAIACAAPLERPRERLRIGARVLFVSGRLSYRHDMWVIITS